MSSASSPIVVVGAGAAGLAAAWAARRRGWEPLILDRAPEAGGAWIRMRAEMRCLSLRRHDRFADGAHPEGDGPHATAAEVARGIASFAARSRFDLRTGVEVLQVKRSAGDFVIETSAGTIRARRLLVASGEYERPFLPTLPGAFDGPADHVRRLRVDDVQRGERVVVVGAGNSGAEIVAELSRRGAKVIVAVRRLPRRPPELPSEGLLEALAYHLSGLPLRLLPFRGGCHWQTPLVSQALHQALDRGLVTIVDDVVALAPDGVRTRSGQRVGADRIVWATGYRRDTAWLEGLLPLDERGRPALREGLVPAIEGLAFVGLPCLRTRRSGFLRGFADDAAAVIGQLR